ncbi:MAG: DUF427 domain-containing protein [Rhodospirillales bacterium]
MERTQHATYCPYKGDSAYYSIPVGRRTVGQRRVDLRNSFFGGCRNQGPMSRFTRTASMQLRNGRRPGAMPWTRWGLRPQTPDSAARLFIVSRRSQYQTRIVWLRRSPQ